MFVPIDILKPIFADLLDKGRTQNPLRPWLGLSADELRGRLFVTRTAEGGPAADAGIEAGDMARYGPRAMRASRSGWMS